MRTIPFNTISARGIHALITITFLDGSALRLTTADSDITISANTWSAAAAVNVTQIQYNSDGSPANADVRIASEVGSLVPPGTGSLGYLDGLPIKIELFDVANPGTGTFDYMPGATIGSVQEDSDGVIILAAQGPLSIMNGPMTELYSAACKARLGDDRCRVPIDPDFITRNKAFLVVDAPGGTPFTDLSWGRIVGHRNVVYECTTSGTTDPTTAPTYSTTPGATIADGTAVFTCRVAFMCQATGQAIDFFNIQLTGTPPVTAPSALGNITPRTGPLANVKLPIRAYDPGTLIVTLFEPYATTNFPVGTDFDVNPGCDRLLSTCKGTFNNLKNMRATPYAPGADVATGRS